MALTLELPPERAAAGGACVAERSPAPRGFAAWAGAPLAWLEERRGRGESTFLLSQLALVLETGTPLATGLRQITAQAEPRMQRVAGALLEELETGSTFTHALTRHPALFSAAEVGMIQVGETGGAMADMLNRVVELRRRRERLVSSVRGAIAYPAVLLVVATGVVIFMLGYIFPRFEKVFQDIGTSLPLSTRILLGTSEFLRRRGLWLLGGLIVSGIAVARWARSTRGARAIERLALATPGLGTLLRQMSLSQFFLNLGALVQAKVPLLPALRIVKGSLRLFCFRDLADELASAAERGEGLAARLARSPMIPGLARSIVLTGEETGRTDQVLLKLAAYYDEQVEKRLKVLSTLIEPVLLVGMGGVVGFVVISLVLPIFRMSRGVH